MQDQNRNSCKSFLCVGRTSKANSILNILYYLSRVKLRGGFEIFNYMLLFMNFVNAAVTMRRKFVRPNDARKFNELKITQFFSRGKH